MDANTNTSLPYYLAEEFAMHTNRPLFITGKAGTGKTTFLRKLREQTPKNMAVVAPTGVAAINAGGMTIHSFFQLPVRTLIPTPQAYKQLFAEQRLTQRKRNLIYHLEMLVIDEISMVRADVLDAIDAVLRRYKYRKDQPFGGVRRRGDEEVLRRTVFLPSEGDAGATTGLRGARSCVPATGPDFRATAERSA